jgi:hypothetical protein
VSAANKKLHSRLSTADGAFILQAILSANLFSKTLKTGRIGDGEALKNKTAGIPPSWPP